MNSLYYVWWLVIGTMVLVNTDGDNTDPTDPLQNASYRVYLTAPPAPVSGSDETRLLSIEFSEEQMYDNTTFSIYDSKRRPFSAQSVLS